MQENETIISQQAYIKNNSKSFFRRYFSLILVLLVIVLALTSAYFYKKSTSNTQSANTVSQAEIKSLMVKVGRIAIVPANEIPTVATVSDPAALSNQVFFVDAKKGDKVLIYTNAKKAFLYDPVLDKIVNIAPLNTDSTASTTPATQTITPSAKPVKKN